MSLNLILSNDQTLKEANYIDEESKPLNKITLSKVKRSRVIFFKEFQTFYKVL